MRTFDELGLPPVLLRAVADLKFTEPTPIQVQAIPPALAGRDILASAQTGSGKSAAFGLPLIARLLDRPRGTTRALVLAPTRELAEQISVHLGALVRHTTLRVAAIYGGVAFGRQLAALASGTEIIIATPGRLLDHLSNGDLRLDAIEMFVLDEADRMLDMGFLPSVRRLLRTLPAQRQTLFFSATLPSAISVLVGEILRDPVRIELAAEHPPIEMLTQRIYSVPQEKKTELLLELFKDNNIYSAIAFTRTKSRANRLAAALSKHRIPTDLIHGDRSQAQRTRALESLKNGKIRVLVATDIAARGIDIVELGHVVNYDVPLIAEDYVHRIGRTARAKASGDAITFVSADEEPLILKIEYTLGRRLEREINPLFPEIAAVAPKPRKVYSSSRRRR
ncbi:MAG: DEAD/DEAH box helicase [Candidatus Eremiobacteraeota bacterium]|nr:DEAD/DEAH box helicase [Candidatus Eremiobacteraeota bacterium]NNM91789.1 DEAD/DEAH box helicase [Candidatus Eremiobacteraeota bacterium]